jgi:cytidine deaminase
MTNIELISKAASVINVIKRDGILIGDVGCALETNSGKIYLGICAATGSNVSCAEQNAIGAMITANEYSIRKIVAVWKDEKGKIYVIPPCGNCRQLMREINEENLHQTKVILGKDKDELLKTLIPYYDLWQLVE